MNDGNDRKQMRVHLKGPEAVAAAAIIVVEATTFIILYHHHPSPCPRARVDHTLCCRHRRFFLLDK
jgi:hypothetical protein